MEADKPVTDSSSLNKSACGTVFHTRSRTETRVSKFCHTWTICNFSFCKSTAAVGEFVESESFSDGTNDEVKWYLRAYPWGYTKAFQDHVTVALKFESSVNFQFKIMLQFSIVNDKQKLMCDQKKICTITQNDLRGFKSFVTRESLFDHENKLLLNDTLTLRCEVVIIRDTVNVPTMGSASNFVNLKSRLLKNLELMFDTQQLSDVTLVTDDRELKAHKMILAANSSVFSAMFKHDMEELKHNRVDIKDMKGDVVEEMLRFMYTGKVTNIKTMADSLLVAADKYAIDSLKLMCQLQLYDSITNENVSDILILADLHNVDELKAQAISYIYMHASDVYNTPSFKLAETSHPSLIMETLRTLTIWTKGGLDASALSVAK